MLCFKIISLVILGFPLTLWIVHSVPLIYFVSFTYPLLLSDMATMYLGHIYHQLPPDIPKMHGSPLHALPILML